LPKTEPAQKQFVQVLMCRTAVIVSTQNFSLKFSLRSFLSPHPPTPVPQIWWFSCGIARSINLLTYLLTYLLIYYNLHMYMLTRTRVSVNAAL